MTSRATELVKLLKRMIKQDHLYSTEKLREMKIQLRDVEEQLVKLKKHTSKGFGS